MSSRNTGFLVFAIILLAAGGGGWWWSTRTPKWNVVVITLDTTRADHLGCYGHRLASTPNLDRQASRGVQFDNAYTVVPITLPSHATMFTGLLPPEHGVRINGTSRLAEDVPTLAEILKQQGYRTGAFVSSLVLDGRFGLSRGFSRYDDRLPQSPGSHEGERSASETISAALGWLRSSTSAPFFCWVHLYDPHEPYLDHPEEFKDRFQGNPYDAELAFMDLHLGRLFDYLRQQGLEEQTLIVIAGDHGQGLGEHQEQTHGFMAYNSTMRVPLIVTPPGRKAQGQRVAEPVSLVDVFPTILDVLRISAPGTTTGRTLKPALQDQLLPGRPCYGETEAPYLEGPWSPLRTWTTSRWKYIHTTRAELYDLVADPGERHNLITEQSEEAESLLQAFSDFESTLKPRQGATTALSPAEEKALAGLGYLRGHAPAVKPEGELRDIKDAIQFVEEAHRCSDLVHHGQADRAQAILRDVVQAVPEYAKAWGMLGICDLVQDQFVDAEQNYRRSLELDANQNFARIGLGRALLAQSRLPEAITQLQAAVKADPGAADGQYFLGEACQKSQRWKEARTAFEAVLILSPDLLAARLALGDVARDSGDLQESQKQYKIAVAQQPRSPTARIRLGQVLVKAGQESAALEQFEELLRMNEPNPEPLVELSRLLSASRDPRIQNPLRAVRLAEQACKLTNRRNVSSLRALAAAYASQREKNLAVTTAKEALALLQGSDSVDLIADIERELAGYEKAEGSP